MWFERFFRRCPKSGKIIGVKYGGEIQKYLLPLIGLLSLIWIFFRVITKPSRIAYPCVRAAIPIASTFLGSLVVSAIAAFAWFRMRRKQIAVTTIFALAGVGGALLVPDESAKEVLLPTIVQPANQPMGEGVGIFPGRVVWVHNPNATNENCVAADTGSPWFAPENNNQAAVDSMVSEAIRALTGQSNDADAWKAIFRFHNARRGKGAVDYSPTEKIFIKTNVVSSWSGNYNTADLSKKKTNYGQLNPYFATAETSPAVVLAVLRQLVNVAGIPQEKIYVGDPLRHIFKHCYDLWHSEFPNVHYLDYSYTTLGREKVQVSSTAIVHFSDKGTVLRPDVWDMSRPGGTTPVYRDNLYTIYEDAEYLLNIPILKGHRRAGTTMFAKNHFGSHTRADASHLHNGLVAPMEMENGITRGGYGLYRVQVDFMAHSLLGKKNLFYLMDALWSTVHELAVPLKWQMPPFNNDYMSSIFASFDPVAIESVGYDFLRAEFTAERGAGTYVQMSGVDDYLHQAADSANWPDGIVYDPDSSGNLFASLGVHEHWNNPIDKQYSRNLGGSEGIELLKIEKTVFVEKEKSASPTTFALSQNYPNPFNPVTTFHYTLPEALEGSLTVFDSRGRKVLTLANGSLAEGSYTVHFDGANLCSGVYYVHLSGISASKKSYSATIKMLLLK